MTTKRTVLGAIFARSLSAGLSIATVPVSSQVGLGGELSSLLVALAFVNIFSIATIRLGPQYLSRIVEAKAEGDVYMLRRLSIVGALLVCIIAVASCAILVVVVSVVPVLRPSGISVRMVVCCAPAAIAMVIGDFFDKLSSGLGLLPQVNRRSVMVSVIGAFGLFVALPICPNATVLWVVVLGIPGVGRLVGAMVCLSFVLGVGQNVPRLDCEERLAWLMFRDGLGYSVISGAGAYVANQLPVVIAGSVAGPGAVLEMEFLFRCFRAVFAVYGVAVMPIIPLAIRMKLSGDSRELKRLIWCVSGLVVGLGMAVIVSYEVLLLSVPGYLGKLSCGVDRLGVMAAVCYSVLSAVEHLLIMISLSVRSSSGIGLAYYAYLGRSMLGAMLSWWCLSIGLVWGVFISGAAAIAAFCLPLLLVSLFKRSGKGATD